MSCPREEGDSSTISVQDDQIRRIQLQMQFQGTRRGDFQTMEAYVKRLKSIAYSLAEIGSSISDSDMVLQLLAGLPSEFSPLQKTISSKWPLPNFEEACSMVYMQEDLLLQHHGEQGTTDPGVVGQEPSSAFRTVEKFVAVVGTVVGVVGTVTSVVGAVSTIPTLVGAVGAVSASRMMVVGAMSAMTAVTGWKIWQAHHRNEPVGLTQ